MTVQVRFRLLVRVEFAGSSLFLFQMKQNVAMATPHLRKQKFIEKLRVFDGGIYGKASSTQ